MGDSPVLEKQTCPCGQFLPPMGIWPSSAKTEKDKMNTKTKIIIKFFIEFLAPF
jgi:hypothetical protein